MKHAILILLAAVAVAGVLFWLRSQKTAASQLHIGDHTTLQVEIVDSALSQAQGLSGRESLEKNTGMLFVFSRPAPRNFWMKDMRFPLDVVWIRDFEVVGFQENILHPEASGGEVVRFQSRVPADMVLEINAGEVALRGIKVGDKVAF
jgi:uncharacterized membrane protein (UPF0127 family)